MAVAVTAAGCTHPLPGSVAGAPVLEVATGLYPLGQAASLIGQTKVKVLDVVPDGSNPFTYTLGAGEAAAVHRAGLAVEVGGGLQPSFEAAAGGARAVVAVRSAAGAGAAANPYVWLDPATMGRVVTAVAGAMERADPPAAPLFRRNAATLQQEISSLAIDYSSTLAPCPGTTLVTPDTAFSAMAASSGRHTVVVGAGAGAAEVAAAARTVQQVTATPVIREPWVDDSGVAAVAAAARVKLRTLDTLAGAPAGGWPHGAGYFALMEQNLGTLSSLLGCGPQTP